MKNNQTLKILVAVLVVLVGWWALKTYLPQKDTDTEGYTQKWTKLQSDRISEVTIQKPSATIDLKKDGGAWNVGAYPADGTVIGDLLTNLMKPASVMVVAETNNRNKDFGIASDSAKLTIQQGSDKQELTLGSVGNGGRYVTFKGLDTVYVVTGIPTTADSVSQNDWIDKTVVKIAEGKISKLTITRKGSNIALAHAGSTWTEAGKQVALDPTGFSGALSTLASLVTQGLADATKIKDYPTVADTTVVVERTDGNPATIKFYPGSSDTLVESSDRAGKYIISSSVMDNFKIEPSSLKPLPTPTPTLKK